MKTLKIDYDTPLSKQCKELGIKVYLNWDYVAHLEKRPANDTIFDIEDGNKMLNIAPSVAEEQFKEQGRRGLTIHEGLALFRHNPKILKSHYLDLVGLQCESGRRPSLYLNGRTPELGAYWDDVANPIWGAPSCRSEAGTLEVGTSELLETRVLALEAWRKKVEKWAENVMTMPQ